MKVKFDPKKFLEKDRIYRPMPGTLNILRLWVWDKEKCEYRTPERGKIFEARRYEATPLGKKRKKQYFESLEMARRWQNRIEEKEEAERLAAQCAQQDNGPRFETIVLEWKSRMFPTFADSTKLDYEKLIRLNFGPLMQMPIRSITPQALDSWLDWLREHRGRSSQSQTRKFFRHELKLLATILGYYQEYHDEDTVFRMPVKKRHRRSADARISSQSKKKDLPEEEFFAFRTALLGQKFGLKLAALATVQYFQALRISEAAAINFEDVKFSDDNPAKARLFISRHVMYIRKKAIPDHIKEGFKNSKFTGGIKEQPIFPETYLALKEMLRLAGPNPKGLVFKNDEGTFFSYRQIQFAFNKAFREANLPYTSTHVMRHGGTRRVFNKTGDVAVAQQILGNRSLQTTLVYAVRNTGALNEVAEAEWRDTNPAPQSPNPPRLRLVASNG